MSVLVNFFTLFANATFVIAVAFDSRCRRICSSKFMQDTSVSHTHLIAVQLPIFPGMQNFWELSEQYVLQARWTSCCRNQQCQSTEAWSVLHIQWYKTRNCSDTLKPTAVVSEKWSSLMCITAKIILMWDRLSKLSVIYVNGNGNGNIR